MSQVPPHDLGLERAMLACVLLSDTTLEPLVSVERLRPTHFYWPTHERIFRAMLDIRDRGERVDLVVLGDELDQEDSERLGEVMAVDFVGSNWRSYAQRLRVLAVLRRKWTAGQNLVQAAEIRDEQKLAEAEALLAQEEAREGDDPDRRREDLFDHAEKGEEESIPWPFRRLSIFAGGMRPGELTVLVGWTSHGKSVLCDQALEGAAKQAKTILYLNEMSVLERDLRYVARAADLPFDRVMRAEFDGTAERTRYARAVEELPFDVVQAAGWTAQEIAYDIRRRRPTVAAVDLLNGIPHQEVRDIDANVRSLASAARQADCHILACQHLNQLRATSSYPPEPVLRDIRGSGQIGDLASNVMFVYRRQDDEGFPGNDASIGFLKVRNGMLGRITARFNGRRMRFELPAEPGVVGTVAA